MRLILFSICFRLLFQSGLLILWNQILTITDGSTRYAENIDDVHRYIDLCSDCLNFCEENALFKYRSNIANICGNTIQMLNKAILNYYNSLGKFLMRNNKEDKYNNMNNLLNDSWDDNLEFVSFFELSPCFLKKIYDGNIYWIYKFNLIQNIVNRGGRTT